jgi:hypothetical protein
MNELSELLTLDYMICCELMLVFVIEGHARETVATRDAKSANPNHMVATAIDEVNTYRHDSQRSFTSDSKSTKALST